MDHGPADISKSYHDVSTFQDGPDSWQWLRFALSTGFLPAVAALAEVGSLNERMNRRGCHFVVPFALIECHAEEEALSCPSGLVLQVAAASHQPSRSMQVERQIMERSEASPARLGHNTAGSQDALDRNRGLQAALG